MSPDLGTWHLFGNEQHYIGITQVEPAVHGQENCFVMQLCTPEDVSTFQVVPSLPRLALVELGWGANTDHTNFRKNAYAFSGVQLSVKAHLVGNSFVDIAYNSGPTQLIQILVENLDEDSSLADLMIHLTEKGKDISAEKGHPAWEWKSLIKVKLAHCAPQDVRELALLIYDFSGLRM